MADLSTCYFCGTIDEPIDDHPVIPPAYDPPAERQRTVAVCASCGSKLDRVVEPLVAALDRADDADRPGGRSAPDRERRDRPAATPDVEAAAESNDDESTDRGASEYPSEARQVLLMLENRSLPVDRDELEELAANAYELDRRAVTEAIDALLDGDVLVEVEGDEEETGGLALR